MSMKTSKIDNTDYQEQTVSNLKTLILKRK